MPKLLDGRVAASEIAEKLSRQIGELKDEPTLAIIQVGDLPASNLYIKRKIAFAEKVGAVVKHLQFAENISENDLSAEIEKLNQDQSIAGIIVQLPLPANFNKIRIIENIAREKDVDGLRAGSPFTPATARGVLALLDFYQITIAGQKAVVIGRSNLVGKPIALALLARGATVTVCHRQTRDLAGETKQADILIVAAGSPHLINQDYVKAGQIVVDVGLSLTPDGKLVGDVDRASVEETVAALSPVPGGVGPMTVASLFMNLVDSLDKN